MLIEGSGLVHIFGDVDLGLPHDPFVFADAPGLADDQIVDTETASINLQSVVEAVRAIVDGIQSENVGQIMGYVSPDYLDPSGADAAALSSSLTTFFEFYEIQSYTESKAINDSFVITNEGDVINAQMYVDVTLSYPQVEYTVPQVETGGTTGGTTTGQMLFSGSYVPFDQTIRMREVFDGRGWIVYLYDIQDYGRRTFELIDTDDVSDLDDINYIKNQAGNSLIDTYIPRSEGIDTPLSISIDVDEDNALQPRNIMAIFKEPYLTSSAPPAFEFTTFDGSNLSMPLFDRVSYKFKRQPDGSVKMISMNMRQVISENDSQFLAQLDVVDQNPLSSLDGQEVALPFGFSFAKRGPVVSVFPGDTDLVLTADTVQVSNRRGMIMMLPENTDIFAINPSLYVNSLTRSMVMSNPFDPQSQAGTGAFTSPGLQASYTPGRAYFVITADGEHYGFFQVPFDDLGSQGGAGLDNLIMTFDYRYENSFVLPDDF